MMNGSLPTASCRTNYRTSDICAHRTIPVSGHRYTAYEDPPPSPRGSTREFHFVAPETGMPQNSVRDEHRLDRCS